MRKSINIILRSVALGLLFSAPLPVLAGDDDHHDHEIARRALLEGRIRPLAEITEAVKPSLPGEILGVEIEIEDAGRIVYEFDVITPEGMLKEVEVDAATASIISIEDED